MMHGVYNTTDRLGGSDNLMTTGAGRGVNNDVATGDDSDDESCLLF